MPDALANDDDLIREAHTASLALLRRNLSPHGILAATPSARASARRYDRVFARDAAVCAMAMLDAGDPVLVEGAIASLDAIADAQADQGQMPKYVEPDVGGADFWYLGCIDASLWWLVATDRARRVAKVAPSRWADATRGAIDWLRAQEHPRFRLLQQNEASDWADIMPRSGFVLYTNALWHYVKRLYGLPHAGETVEHFNGLFQPFEGERMEYARARLLVHYVRRRARRSDLYLSFVNFASWGEEGDVFGNLLAVLLGPASDAQSEAVVQALLREGVAQPYPVRAVCDPIGEDDPLWRDYMRRHRQNLDHQYHNGGIWPMVGGFWVMALAMLGKREAARASLVDLARVNALGGWRFNEWLHGRTLAPMGMDGQSWNAAAFLAAQTSLDRRVF